ncbi:IS3 family transposase, partial [Leptospira soteropolitanensis]
MVVNEIRRLAFKRKRAGYRMIYKFMRKAGWRINHKKVYRLYSR